MKIILLLCAFAWLNLHRIDMSLYCPIVAYYLIVPNFSEEAPHLEDDGRFGASLKKCQKGGLILS